MTDDDVQTLIAAGARARAEVERLTAERDEALAEVERLTVVMHAQQMADAGGIAVRDLPFGAVQASRLMDARDQARRAALEEAIRAVEDGVPGDVDTREVLVILRALLTQPVRPAPVGASEGR